MSGPEVKLFYWMSHVGSGAKDRLRRATDSLLIAWSEKEREMLVSTLLDRSTRLGHLTRTSTSGWLMRSPSLTLTAQGEGAFWRGGLSPDIEQHLECIAEATGCRLEAEVLKWSPPRLFLYGERDALAEAGSRVGARFEEDAPRLAAALAPDLRQAPDTWPEQPLPTGAELSSFDFSARAWTPHPGGLPGSGRLALRCENRFGGPSFFVALGQRVLKARSENQAVFVAADGVPLCTYDERSAQFQTFRRLPPEFALPLCLCTGRTPIRAVDSSETYEAVPPQVGQLIMQRLGQTRSCPTIHWF